MGISGYGQILSSVIVDKISASPKTYNLHPDAD